MKREGRQHGMVRTCRIIPSPWNPRPKSRFVNELDFPPTAGLFTKVSSKPTNHSKFTGNCSKPRCSSCRLHPVQKAKVKTKGSHKLKLHHLVNDFPLVDCDTASFIDDDGDDQPLEVTDFQLRVEDIHHHHVDNEDEDEDETSYCKVEFVVDEAMEGDDAWCLVEEMKAI